MLDLVSRFEFHASFMQHITSHQSIHLLLGAVRPERRLEFMYNNVKPERSIENGEKQHTFYEKV